ncbi:MAG: hypothetical protein R6V13_13030 [Anaerolineae bacterium]
MTTWESLAHGASYLAFAHRVMGRGAGLDSAVRRSTEQGSRLRQKYALRRVKPLSMRRLEPLVRRFPLQERRAEDEELVLASAVPGWWSQETERQVQPSEPIERPSSGPRSGEPTRAADMRAAVQRARASAEARRQAAQKRRPSAPIVTPRAGREEPPKDIRSLRRRAQLVEEPDRQRTSAPEPAQPVVGRPSSVVEEAETPRQRGGISAEAGELAREAPVEQEPGEVASDGVRTEETETRPGAPSTARPVSEPSPARTARPERAAVRGEEVSPRSVAEEADIAPAPVEAEAEEGGEGFKVSPEPVPRETGEGTVPRVARHPATDRERAETLSETEISAPEVVEMIPGAENETPLGEPEVYTRLGATSYEGNLRPEEASPLGSRRVPGKPVGGRRSMPEALEAVPEEISRRAPLEEAEVTEGAGEQERPVSSRVHRAVEGVPEGDARGQKEVTSRETLVPGVDRVPVSREAEKRGASENRPTLREERLSEAETESAPGANVAYRAPRAARSATPPDRLVREEGALSERIERSEERASAPPAGPVSRERDVEDVGEDASLDTDGPGLQDVPLEEALFRMSGVRRRARRPSNEESSGAEASFVLPSISFRPPEARERVSLDQVRRAAETQVPAEPIAEVESVEAEAPDLGEEEEIGEGVDVGKLADEIYRRIRDRLRIERERYGRRGRW